MRSGAVIFQFPRRITGHSHTVKSVTGQHRLTPDDNEPAAVIDHAKALSPGHCRVDFINHIIPSGIVLPRNFPGKLQPHKLWSCEDIRAQAFQDFLTAQSEGYVALVCHAEMPCGAAMKAMQQKILKTRMTSSVHKSVYQNIWHD